VSEYWKGNPGRAITLHVLEPGTDCIGASFDAQTKYLVFAKSQKVDDYRLGKSFWYGWLDLMPAGTEILTVNNFCDSTEQEKKAGKTLRVLGKGQKPRA
jgi:hypothetical protein